MKRFAMCVLLAATLPAVAANRAFNVTAHKFSFDITPQPFTVNQGDVVTLTITATDDGKGDGHGIRMEPYITGSHPLHPGSPVTITFTAHTAGEFEYLCTRICGGGHSGMNGIFTVLEGPSGGPAINDVSPGLGPTSGGTAFTIHGSGFATGATVLIGTFAALNVAVENATTIHAVTPPGPFDINAPTPVGITVTNADASSAFSNNAFVWTVPPPSIQFLTPTRGTAAGGTQVTIRGAGFSTAVGLALTFGGAPATDITVIDAITLSAHTPAHAAGAADVVITTNKGGTTSAGGYTFAAEKRRTSRH